MRSERGPDWFHEFLEIYSQAADKPASVDDILNAINDKRSETVESVVADYRKQVGLDAFSQDDEQAQIKQASFTPLSIRHAKLNEEDSIATDSHGEIAKIEDTKSMTSTPAWFDFTASSEVLSDNEYILNGVADGDTIPGADAWTKTDSVPPSHNTYSESNASYTTIRDESPWTEVKASGTSAFSIYATYTAGGGDLTVNVNDTVSLSESITSENIELGGININDTISITESVSVNIPSISDLSIDISDDVSITESITIENTELAGINVNDDISVTESVGPCVEGNILFDGSSDSDRGMRWGVKIIG